MENRPRWFGPALYRSARRVLDERLYPPPEWPHAAGVRKPDGANPGYDLREPGRWSAWLTDERLKPNHPQFPGANGIKIRDDWAWISVSGRRLILRTPLQPDGRPGPIETAATHVLADDFAFGASGSLYIATHPEQTVFRLDAAGNRPPVAGPDTSPVCPHDVASRLAPVA